MGRWLRWLGAICWVSAVAGVAHADDATLDTCLTKHTQAQERRLTGQLLESREALSQCSMTQCPRRVRQDCLRWLEEIQVQTPSLSFRVSADGTSRADVSVFIDGQLVLEKLSGRSVDVNPGSHRVRVELPPYRPFERELIVNEGEKFRLVEVSFASAPRTVVQPVPSPVLRHRPVPVATYVFLGVGVAAAASGGVWGGAAWLARKELERDCAPECSQKRINGLKQRALIADVSLGVSALSLASAATVYLLRPELPVEPALKLEVTWLPSGGALANLRLNTF